MKNKLQFSCPACGEETTVESSRKGTTGRTRFRLCGCGQKFTTYQPTGGIEAVALVLDRPTLRPYPAPKFPTEWERRRYQEWLTGLLAEVKLLKCDC